MTGPTHDRSAIKERLRRLLAVTVDSGATEAEAMIAADKASALMAEHSLSYRNVAEIEAEEFADDERPWFRGKKNFERNRNGFRRSGPVPHVVNCLGALCELCGVEHMLCTWHGTLTFFGPPHATEAAHYFIVIISRAMEREWQAFKTANPSESHRRAAFLKGMSLRISERLMDMCEQQRKAASTGNDLVVVANALVKQRFFEKHPNTTTRSTSIKGSDYVGLHYGYTAGDNVALSRGINEAHGAKLLESK